MAASFEYYGQTVATATPPPPAAYVPPQASTAAAPQVATATRGSDRLMRAGACLLTFAGVLLLAAFLAAATPLGRIDADVTVPFLAVTVGGLAAIAWAVLR